MTINQLITYITQGALILIALQTLVDFLRHRDRTRFEVFLLFGGLALIVLAQWLNNALNQSVPLLGRLGSILLVAHPYLLLRLVQHLRHISERFHLAALSGMILSWLFIIAFPPPLPALATLFIVAYFVYVESFSALSLIRGALTTTGVTHWRLLLAAGGSILLAVLILFAGINAIFPAAAPVLMPLNQLLGLVAILSYYFGFATPNWLRRSWQLSELYRFLSGASGQWIGERKEATLQRLCSSAERAVGGLVAAVALWDDTAQRLVITVSRDPALVPPMLPIESEMVERAWRKRQPALVKLPAQDGQGSGQFAGPSGAGAVLAVPIATQEHAWGILLVYLLRTPLFVSDDLALLSMLSEQTAAALGYVNLMGEQQTLIEQLRRYNKRLQAVNELDRAILAARSTREIAGAALARLRQLVILKWASVVLFDSDRGQARFIATDSLCELGPAEGSTHPLEDFPFINALMENIPGIYIEDISNYEPSSPILEHIHAQGIRSAIVTPLFDEGKLIGELILASTEAAAFQGEDRDIAREVADQLAVSIQQARLREELQRYTAELEQRVAERTAQLEASNKELEAFAYSVSHDLRAPLRAIDGFSRILLTKYAPELTEEARRYLELVSTNSQEMGQLIDDLLSFSRLSRQDLVKQLVEPAAIVRLVVDELLKDQEGRKIEVTVGELPGCYADPALLKQVFVNLLSNALKFTGQRETACIEVGHQTQDGRQVYFVKDNGVGFDMQYAHKLFAVFQRLHRAEEFEGTGVGLAIVQRIISRHGGQIWAEAQVDKGATFFFTLS